MLEFIVLGQIPGTQLQITIAWFAFAVLGVLIWTDLKFHREPSNHKAAKTKGAIKKSASKKTRKAPHKKPNLAQA